MNKEIKLRCYECEVDVPIESHNCSYTPMDVKLPCLECGKEYLFSEDSNQANGVFNVFCPGGECEDKYAFKQ